MHECAGRALARTELDDKVAAVGALAEAWSEGRLDRSPCEVLAVTDRGRPRRPALVAPRSLPRRGLGTPAGRVAAVHAVAHIEANAIDLALDAVHRFGQAGRTPDGTAWDAPPDAFVDDWVAVAADEARHFVALRHRLHGLGADYGDLPAHGGLWAAAERSADDPLRRMALVPRVLEARGLDVTPAMIERFEDAGDGETAAVLRTILAEEVAHVAVGSRWFRHHCHQRDLEPEVTFRRVLDEAGVRVVPPLNDAARRRAGFSDAEMASLVARSAR